MRERQNVSHVMAPINNFMLPATFILDHASPSALSEAWILVLCVLLLFWMALDSYCRMPE
jgi:hypothetical protein